MKVIEFDKIDYSNKERLQQLIRDRESHYGRIIKRYANGLYLTINAIEAKTFQEKMYTYLYGHSGCQRCGTKTSFINIFEGFSSWFFGKKPPKIS